MYRKMLIKKLSWLLLPLLFIQFSVATETIKSFPSFTEIERSGSPIDIQTVNGHWSQWERDCVNCDGRYSGWMMHDGKNMEIKQFIEDMRYEMGPWFIPVMAIIMLFVLLIGVLSIVFSLLFFGLLIFVSVKVIQAIARSNSNGDVPTKETVQDEAMSIGKYVYYLYLVSIIFPVLSIAGVIISYIYQGKASEWMKSHYQFMIRTFWIGFLYCTISTILLVVAIGFVGYIFLIVWIILRSLKGLRLHQQNQPIPKSTTWLW